MKYIILRAPTPSGGAEIAVPDQIELLNYLDRLNNQNRISLNQILKLKVESLKRIESSYVFRDPLRFTQDKSKRLDYAIEKLELLNPINRLQQSKIDLDKTMKSLHDYYNRYLTRKQNEYVLSINKLELLNPLSIMKKGYSVVKIKNTVIKSVDEISIEDNIEILVSDGTLNARVTDKRKDE